ncbi:coil containing protein [Vibrio phage 1.030.O._10N.222.55.F9]|nr:coil containing protein [Vibrio phage 1.030.O._10N.222.55.F9]
MNSKQEEQVEQEHLSREHMSKMIRAQTVVMKQVHEDNLALQQENAELRDEVQAKTDLLALVVVENSELREFLESLQLDVTNEIKLEQLLNKND